MSDIDEGLREMFRRRENDVLAPSRPVEPIVVGRVGAKPASLSSP